jgi:hypothetical protein
MLKQFFTLCMALLLLSGCATVKNTPAPASSQSQQDAPIPVLAETATPIQVIVPVATSISTPTVAPTDPSRQVDECSNPYYPVVNGATWVYETTGVGQSTHTMTTGDNNQFTITITDDDSTFILEGQCTDDGIVLVDQGMNAIYKDSQGGSTLTTQSEEGVSLPKDIQQGDEWSQTIKMSASGGEETLNSTINSDFKALGYESVTVPAGTFQALKIEQSSSVTMNEVELMTSNSLLWYVEGVGNVKAEQQAGGSETYIVQLISYDIP